VALLGALTDRLENVGASWAKRRQGRDDPSGVTLQRRRLYILPTGYGAVFALVLFSMLLGSINYGANLAYAMTFLLTGLVLVVLHHCHNNLLGLSLRFAGAQPVYVGNEAKFRVALTNASSAARYEVEVAPAKRSMRPVDIAPGQTQIVEVGIPTRTRGWLPLERFSVSTLYPANLFRAWTWIHMPAECLVYPRPAAPGRPLPDTHSGTRPRLPIERSDADFRGLRNANSSDSPRHIAWKAYARNDELLVKQFAGGTGEPCMLDWDDLPGLDVEARISQLARWCLDASAQSRHFGLRIPGTVVPLGGGTKHLHECLKALALFGLEPNNA
jgi:uncharacterized protein (DUF58 family)